MADFTGENDRDDTLSGGSFGTSPVNDRLFGLSGNDTYSFTRVVGSDQITDTAGTDRILFDSSISRDMLRFNTSGPGSGFGQGQLFVSIVDEFDNLVSQITVHDQLDGLGVESITFADGSSMSLGGVLTLQGYAGDTDLIGTLRADRFQSTTRNERFFGDQGDDTYLFAADSGLDSVTDSQGRDRIQFDASVTRDAIRLNTSGTGTSFGVGDLFISVVDEFENVISQITVNDHLGGRAVETLAFADGSTLTLTGGLTLQGAVGDTDLTGTFFADRMISTTRNETLRGDQGADTYVFSEGFGFDRVTDAQGSDRILIDDSIDRGDVRLVSNGPGSAFGEGDLFINVVDELENVVGTITLQDHLDGKAIETLEFADGSRINLLGGLTIRGAIGWTDLAGTAQNDTLVGSERNEVFRGNIGNDSYRLAAGFGTDTIFDTGGTDTVAMTGINPGRVTLLRTSTFTSTLTVQVQDRMGNVTDTLSLANYFAEGSGKVETLNIGGARFNIAAQLAGPVTSTRADKVGSFLGNTVIDGKGGNDRLSDLFGNNTLSGGAGNDTLLGGAGNDQLIGGLGADRMNGGAGDDRMDGGRSNDVLTSGAGADVIVFATGSGRDRVTDFSLRNDTLLLDDALWTGTRSARQVVRDFGRDTGADVVLDFGRKGAIVLEGVSSLAGLADVIEII
ncbi:calcium-binding protein [Gemmobacter denitrificans]|uniref:Hemolysin type calcium-binding protein n=1 Tax=Gemmobacter denitrificans TaxID=3123040 RepID=A0ABU8BYP5_9RHOB